MFRGSQPPAQHIAALTKVRMRVNAGRAYYDRRIAQGETHNDAMRCRIGASPNTSFVS